MHYPRGLQASTIVMADIKILSQPTRRIIVIEITNKFINLGDSSTTIMRNLIHLDMLIFGIAV